MANRSRRPTKANLPATRPGQPPVKSFASRLTPADKVELDAMKVDWKSIIETETAPEPEHAMPVLQTADEVFAELTAALAREREERWSAEQELARMEERLEAAHIAHVTDPAMRRNRLLTGCLIGLSVAVAVWVALIIIF